MALDRQYIRRYRSHIPFYKSEFPNQDRRVYWHHNRCLCDPDCIFGIPVVGDQFIMFVVEDDAPTGEPINPFGASANARIELCCIEDGDAADCPDLDISGQGSPLSFAEHKVCVIEGSPIQFNYLRFQFPDDTNCGLHYLKIVQYDGTPNERIFYSQPIYVYRALDAIRRKLVKLNINDTCSIGGINWSQIYEGWGNPAFIDGYEVYLPEGSAVSFVEEVTDEEVEEDGKGNEIQIFKKVDVRYQFDTAYVPDHYAEIIKELEMTDNNAVTIPDKNAQHYVEISRAVSTYTPDNDGCFVNVNMSFIIKSYSKDACCDVDQCTCPEDNQVQAISYTTNQDDAEVDPQLGDTYIVPNNGPAPNNPDWKTQDNRIAVWNGSGWDYTDNTEGSYAFVDDAGDNYLSLGLGNIWVAEDAYITQITEVGGGSCTITVTAVIPTLTWAKIQISPAGAGTWTDIDGVYYSLAQWLAGETFSVPVAGNYDFRLVHLDIGCGLDPSPIENFITTESCV